ncbi:MAG: prenyltransferase/squalene oxidase repeat-containing protein [Thermomicrobiales bacterium]
MQTARTESFDSDVPVNSIHRSQERFFVARQVRRLTATGMLLVALVLSAFAAPVSAQDNTQSVEAAVQWLLAQQAEDGGFIGFSGESDPGATVDAVLALASAQQVGIDIDLETAMKYLESQALVYAQFSPGAAAKLSMALVAAGMDPHNIDNVDPMSIVIVAAGLGMIGLGPYDHALGLQALVATGEPVPDTAIQAARDSQIEDGSWAFDGSTTAGAGDTNTTAQMVMGLIAAGVHDEMVDRGLAYLAGATNDDGGYPYQPGAESDANSTALVLQAFIASGDPALADALDEALGALLDMQNESGAFAYMRSVPDDNQFATAQAIPAVAGVAFPLPVKLAVLATPEATPAG